MSKVKFTHTRPINSTLMSKDGRYKFSNGVYITDNEAEIADLKSVNGLIYEEVSDDVVVDKDEHKEPEGFSIPKSWTYEKILEFASEKGIAIPDEHNTKAKAKEYIELVYQE